MSPDARRTVAVTVARLAIAATLYAVGALVYGGTAAPPATVVLAATIVVAVMLWATRAWVERAATRIALGSRAQSYQAVHDLLRQMTSSVAVDDVVPRLAQAAGRALGGPSAQVRVWMSGGEGWTQTWPTDAAGGGASVTVEVAHSGTDVGEIEVHVDPAHTSAFDRRLLNDLAAQAGIALSTVRLTHDLRRRRTELAALAEAVAASRDRLLTARRDEQRRLRHEVQDQVVSHIESALALVHGVDLPAASLCSAEALDALRLIARGIFPPGLGAGGFAAAVDGWLERADLYAQIEVDPNRAMTPSIEVCLYFCAVTALGALAAADARALRVHVRVDDHAVLTVSGFGSQAFSREVCTVIRDRIEAYDGSATFDQGAMRAAVPMPDRS
jgi:hypothetical protein